MELDCKTVKCSEKPHDCAAGALQFRSCAVFGSTEDRLVHLKADLQSVFGRRNAMLSHHRMSAFPTVHLVQSHLLWSAADLISQLLFEESQGAMHVLELSVHPASPNVLGRRGLGCPPSCLGNGARDRQQHKPLPASYVAGKFVPCKGWIALQRRARPHAS